MSLSSRLRACCAALAVLPATGAFAADYDPPIFVEEAPEYVPVEVGSGWYLRGDVAYNANKTFRHRITTFANYERFTQSTTPIVGSVGFGYHFSDFLRAEANLGLLTAGSGRLDYALGAPVGADVNIRARNTMWSGIVSLYGDLGTVAGFTPYVGAGVGLVLAKRDYRRFTEYYAPGTPDLDYRNRDHNYSFAYSLGAGVAYNVSSNLSLDVGYQYLSAPRAEYVQIAGSQDRVRKGVNVHQIKVGLRYALW